MIDWIIATFSGLFVFALLAYTSITPSFASIAKGFFYIFLIGFVLAVAATLL
jgi:hypothetical protein